MKPIHTMTDAEYIEHLEVQVQEMAKALKASDNIMRNIIYNRPNRTKSYADALEANQAALAKCQPGDFLNGD